MMTPGRRLILLAGAAGAACAAAFAAGPGFFPLWAGLLAAVAAVAVLDALAGRRRLARLSAETAPLTRMFLGRDGEIPLLLRSGGPGPLRVRAALSLPPEFESPRADVTAELAGPGVFALSWPCRGLRRGEFASGGVWLETPSPLGLWDMRGGGADGGGRIRVYPDMLRDRRGMASVFLNRGAAGTHARRQVGRGREVEKLRDYMPGDGYEDIHWKATAKRGRPVSKEYQIERTQEVYVCIDASRLSAREVLLPPAAPGGPETRTTQLERQITAALLLGLVAGRQGDLFGLALFDDQMRAFVRARSGGAHYGACRDAVYAAQPRMVNPDFAEAFSFLRLRLRRRALLVFLTCLDDPVAAEQFAAHIRLLSSRHVVLVNAATDPLVAPLFTGEAPAGEDGAYRRLGGHLLWRRLRETGAALQRLGAPVAVMRNETLCPQVVARYMETRRRQLL